MLHSYSFSNLRSFRQRTEVSFLLTDKDVVNGWARHSPISSQRLSTALAVLGPNASGKTSLIQPLAFLNWFITSSFSTAPNSGVPVVPHFGAIESPIDFEVIVDSWEPETVFRYRLSVNATVVLSESLETKVRRGQWKIIFDRRRTTDGKYAVIQDRFGLDPAQAEAARPNVSLISWAAQFGVDFARRLTNTSFTTNVTAGGKTWQPLDNTLSWSSEFFAKNESVQSTMRTLLAKWDLGLADVVIGESEYLTANGEKAKQWHATGVHLDKMNRQHFLPFAQESSGTKAAYSLLALILPVLESGGVVAFDELDSDLHPHMLEPLLDLFASERSNPNGAQIIFTCHSPEILRLLQKCQVLLVEKNGLDSEAWRLDSVEGVRVEDNRMSKYLAGAYGAVPRL